MDTRHTEFDVAVGAAKAAHSEAIAAATRNYNARCAEAREQWQATSDVVWSRYNALKSTPEHPEFAAAHRAVRDLPRQPGDGGASAARHAAVVAADAELAEALRQARAQLQAAPAPARRLAR